MFWGNEMDSQIQTFEIINQTKQMTSFKIISELNSFIKDLVYEQVTLIEHLKSIQLYLNIFVEWIPHPSSFAVAFVNCSGLVLIHQTGFKHRIILIINSKQLWNIISFPLI